MMLEEIIRNLINMNNTYIGEAPVDVDKCQWILPISGNSEIHFEGDTYDSPNYRLYVRDLNNQQAKNTIYGIYKRLQCHIGGNYVIVIRRLPYYVGRDVKYRSIYALNIECQLGGY